MAGPWLRNTSQYDEAPLRAEVRHDVLRAAPPPRSQSGQLRHRATVLKADGQHQQEKTLEPVEALQLFANAAQAADGFAQAQQGPPRRALTLMRSGGTRLCLALTA